MTTHTALTPQSDTNQEAVPIHVLLVDDHPAVRHGIRQLIADQPDMVMVAEHSSASRDTSEVARWADVAVVDYHLGDRDGLWLTGQIKQRPGSPPVLIYSAFADTPLAVAAIVAGADGLLPKATLGEELTIAIRRLLHGRQYFPAIPASITGALSARLAPDDQAILSMLVHGVPVGEIASRLRMAPGELEARRQLIVRTIAPKGARAGVPPGSGLLLDYDRPLRRWRYRKPARS
ncbi:MAG TPA: response regulator transcription factor [Solirubrobacteraceae bacterium]|nr:response regulator transcription factor [Solirubrobacteraceae bacterium]